MVIPNQPSRVLVLKLLLTMMVFAALAATASNNGESVADKLSETDVQQTADKDESSEWSQCESYCSPAKPGTSVAEIRWRVSQGPLSVREMAVRKAQEVIEVSVYKDGFERGLYAQVSPVGTARRFALINKLPAQKRMPGLDRLVLVGVATSRETNKKGFRMAKTDTSGQGGEWAVAKVEGLEPGLIYFWRVQSKTAGATPTTDKIVSCQAATCPVDSMRRLTSKRRTRAR